MKFLIAIIIGGVLGQFWPVDWPIYPAVIIGFTLLTVCLVVGNNYGFFNPVIYQL